MIGTVRNLLLAGLTVGAVAFAGHARAEGATADAGAGTGCHDVAQTQGWIVRAQDNVCGLRDARQLSNPALVDFRALMEETEEMRRLRRDRIDPNSPQGVQLRDAARSKVAGACEAVMAEQGHCSVWTAIRHSDNRQVPDVTVLVRNRM